MNAPDVLILCGGKGERLRSVVNDRPKPLADFHGRPFLDFLVDDLIRQNFDRFILLGGYQGEQIQAYALAKNNPPALSVTAVIERLPLGTAGALRHALPVVAGPTVIVLNGDSYCPLDYHQFYEFHKAQSADLTIAVSHCADDRDYGSMRIDSAGRIHEFAEKQPSGNYSGVNAGVYAVNIELLKQIPDGCSVSLEQEMIPRWLELEFKVCAFDTLRQHIDIGTPERLSSAQTYFVKERK